MTCLDVSFNQQLITRHEHLHLQCKECGKIIHIKKNDGSYHVLEKDYVNFFRLQIFLTIGIYAKYV